MADINKKELVVFLDVKPAETIDVTKDQFLCFTAVTAGGMESFKYKQFKKTRGTKRKISTVKRLNNQIEDNVFDIKAISIIGKMNGQYVHWAYESINKAREQIGAEWTIIDNEPKYLNWNRFSFEVKHALGIILYANLLPLIGLRFATFAKKYGYTKLTFALDNLPSNSMAGMQLIRKISETGDIWKMWKNNLENGVSFKIANLLSYSNESTSEAPGKNYPNAILADWLSVAVIAKINPKQLQTESGFTESEIDSFVELWKTVNSKRTFDLINVDDPEFTKRIKNFCEKNCK